MKTTGSDKEHAYELMMKSFNAAWIINVLKMHTDIRHPLPVNKISRLVTETTGIGDSGENITRTIARRLKDLEDIGNSYTDTQDERKRTVAEIAYRVFGGRVCAVNEKSVCYYFEPILANSDVSMILAALRSNHYLSEEEIEFLTTRTSTVLSYNEKSDKNLSYIEAIPDKLPGRPKKNDACDLPIRSSVTLNKINTIYRAIKDRYRLFVVSGTYFPNGGNVAFGPKEGKTGSVINPYAMLSQNGQYYVVATRPGENRIRHYRVDRMFSVEIICDENASPEERDPVPEVLTEFFDRNNRFRINEYTSKFPLMVYPVEDRQKNICYCKFSCPVAKLYIPVDYFGAELQLNPGYSEDQVLVGVHADYNNVRMFCTEFSFLITPVSPPSLVTDVKTELENALNTIS